MNIIAHAPVRRAPQYQLDADDTVSFARIPADLDRPAATCPLGTPWCAEHHGPGWLIEEDNSDSCTGDVVIVKTMAPDEQYDITVNLDRIATQEPGEDFYDQSMVHLEAVGECDLTAAQALQLAAVLTDQAMRLLAGERVR